MISFCSFTCVSDLALRWLCRNHSMLPRWACLSKSHPPCVLLWRGHCEEQNPNSRDLAGLFQRELLQAWHSGFPNQQGKDISSGLFTRVGVCVEVGERGGMAAWVSLCSQTFNGQGARDSFSFCKTYQVQELLDQERKRETCFCWSCQIS